MNKRFFYPLFIILIIVNIFVWNYYISNYTTFYKDIFYDEYKKKLELGIKFFDVQAGNICFIRTPTGKNILLDAKFSRSVDYKKRKKSNVVLNYLKDNNINSLDRIIITSFDADNLLNVLEILKTIPVGEVIDCIGDSDNRDIGRLRYFLRRHPEIGHYKPRINDFLELDPFINIEVLGLRENGRTRPLVLKLIYDKFSFAFTGILDLTDMIRLTKYGKRLNAVIFRYPTNNVQVKLALPFLHLVKPEAFIISGIDNNKYGIADYNIWNLRMQFNAKIYYTSYNGNIEITTNGENYKVNTAIKHGR